MGSYGIGPARIAAAAAEQQADEAGIAWPRALAPFELELVGLGRAGTRGAGVRRRALRRAARARRRRPLRRPRPRPGPEVRRRRAARLPAADHRRQAHAVGRRAGAAGSPRPRDAQRRAGGRCRGGARAVADAPVDAQTHQSRRPTIRRAPADGPPPARPRPLRAAAGRDARRRAAQPVDDPQCDRLRAAGADPRLPGRRALERRRHRRAAGDPLRRDRLGRLRRRDGCARSRASTAASAR